MQFPVLRYSLLLKTPVLPRGAVGALLCDDEINIGPCGGHPTMSILQANKKTDIAVAVGMLGASFYWMFTYSGPYRYLAELQLKWFHQYVPKLTLLAIMAGLLALLALAKAVLRGAERPAPSMPQLNSPAMAASVGTSTGQSASDLFASPFWRLWFLAIPLIMGGYS